MVVYAVWRTRCWKCDKNVRAALHYSRLNDKAFLWQESMPETTIARLSGLGVTIEKRKVGQPEKTCYINVCPHCRTSQSDSRLEKDMREVMRNDPGAVKFVDIDDSPDVQDARPDGHNDFHVMDMEIARLMEMGIAVDVERSKATERTVDAMILRNDTHSFEELNDIMASFGYVYLNRSRLGYLFRRSVVDDGKTIARGSLDSLPA